MTDLKPCPFCGNNNQDWLEASVMHVIPGAPTPNNAPVLFDGQVVCKECCTTGPLERIEWDWAAGIETKEQAIERASVLAIEAWDKRV